MNEGLFVVVIGNVTGIIYFWIFPHLTTVLSQSNNWGDLYFVRGPLGGSTHVQSAGYVQEQRTI